MPAEEEEIVQELHNDLVGSMRLGLSSALELSQVRARRRQVSADDQRRKTERDTRDMDRRVSAQRQVAKALESLPTAPEPEPATAAVVGTKLEAGRKPDAGPSADRFGARAAMREGACAADIQAARDAGMDLWAIAGAMRGGASFAELRQAHDAGVPLPAYARERGAGREHRQVLRERGCDVGDLGQMGSSSQPAPHRRSRSAPRARSQGVGR